MPSRSRDRCTWSIGATPRSSMRPRGARDERHLSVVRDRVSRGPRQGPGGRRARALRGVQQRVCGEPRGRRRSGRRRGGTRRRSSPAGARCSGGCRRTAAAPRSRSGRPAHARCAAPAAPSGSGTPAPARDAALFGTGCRASAARGAAHASLATAGVAPRAPAPPAPPSPPAPAPPAPGAPAGAAPGQRMTSPLRPVNPFMVQDPKQKARRLARALVSDLVVYHPEKRQQGLRDGTLPQLFKDEIEKSWQEYVEQVGAELAKTTPFWAEALNEILAGGNKVF